MTEERTVGRLWPQWMANVGTMRTAGAQVRSQCCRCRTQLRVDLPALSALHGPGHVLLDALDRCHLVGCDGTTFYLAARTYGRPWTIMLREPTLLVQGAAVADASTS